MFTLLPYRLQEVLQLALNSAHRVLQKNAQCHTEEEKKRKKRGGTIGVGSTTLPTERDLPPPPSKRQRLDGGREGGVACKAGEAGGGGVTSEEDFLDSCNTWIESARCGYSFLEIDPASNCWYLNSVNNWMSEFVGFHREELLARFANCELNLACSEFRQLCAHVSALLFQVALLVQNCLLASTKVQLLTQLCCS
jgi:hypothetical protein